MKGDFCDRKKWPPAAAWRRRRHAQQCARLRRVLAFMATEIHCLFFTKHTSNRLRLPTAEAPQLTPTPRQMARREMRSHSRCSTNARCSSEIMRASVLATNRCPHTLHR
jgi:hypothetical protein